MGGMLTLPQRKEKSYIRSCYSTDTVYTFFRYKQVVMTLAKRAGTTTRLTDGFAETLLLWGVIDEAQKKRYEAAVCAEYCFKDCHPEQSPEEIYDFICRQRLACFGRDVMRQGRDLLRTLSVPFDTKDGIDQSHRKKALMESCESILFILTQPELFPLMETDIQTALALGKTVYLCATPDGTDMPTPHQLETWLGSFEGIYFLECSRNHISIPQPLEESIQNDMACLLFYGEDGLLYLRDMALDAIVHAIPNGYHAQALCNLTGQPRGCIVYIPKGLDITGSVPLAQRTRSFTAATRRSLSASTITAAKRCPLPSPAAPSLSSTKAVTVRLRSICGSFPTSATPPPTLTKRASAALSTMTKAKSRQVFLSTAFV